MVQTVLPAWRRTLDYTCPALREILRSGEYGRLVPYGDTRALAEAIIAELRNPGRAKELRPEYRLEQFRERYLEVLEG